MTDFDQESAKAEAEAHYLLTSRAFVAGARWQHVKHKTLLDQIANLEEALRFWKQKYTELNIEIKMRDHEKGYSK